MPKRCRVCRESLPADPCLGYHNMPCSAQGFLDAAGLAHDCGVDLCLYQCSACGLVQLPREPVRYYREVIRAVAYSDEMRVFRERQFSEWAARHALIGRSVLEVGCGYGEYLTLLRAAGIDASGLEASTVAVRHCRDQRLPVRQGYLTRRSRLLPGAPYAAFVTLNFLEHWPDPVGSLRSVWRNLSEDAVGLIEVPNFERVIKQGLFSEFIADHLLYFCEDTLRFTLQLAGFDVVICDRVWHDHSLSVVVKKRMPIDVGYIEKRRLALVKTLREFISYFPQKQVAVWGASHEALTIIALAQIGDKLRYIVDSATFKQGKFSPASHVRIVAPSTLTGEPVKAVIVMASSYSDEVAKFIRHNFDPNLRVVILRDSGLEAV